mmetsp:Transcript_27458/g.69880  ORF Transcript_27458/g.69880 Transcript_27458/m.69880 type:complete len:271 (-) Transcript_27458:462-1274(-)
MITVRIGTVVGADCTAARLLLHVAVVLSWAQPRRMLKDEADKGDVARATTDIEQHRERWQHGAHTRRRLAASQCIVSRALVRIKRPVPRCHHARRAYVLNVPCACKGRSEADDRVAFVPPASSTSIMSGAAVRCKQPLSVKASWRRQQSKQRWPLSTLVACLVHEVAPARLLHRYVCRVAVRHRAPRLRPRRSRLGIDEFHTLAATRPSRRWRRRWRRRLLTGAPVLTIHVAYAVGSHHRTLVLSRHAASTLAAACRRSVEVRSALTRLW